MKKMFALATIVTASIITPITAHAQLGGLLGGSKSSSKVSAGDIDSFLKTANEADGLIRKSSETLFLAVATKSEIDAHNDKVKAANDIADPKEKEAALKKVADDEQAQLAKIDFSKKAEAAKKGMDAKQKALTSAAIYNFALGALKDKELIGQGQSLISGAASNPMLLSKIGGVKDVVSSLSSQMGNITTIVSGLQKLSSAVGLEALPTKATDQPKIIAD